MCVGGWGLRYEADLVIVTPSGYAYGVEIKTNISDLRREKYKKSCAHNSQIFSKLYFAVPRDMEKYIGEIRADAGVFVNE
jgi:hypothetical protein